MENSWLRKFLNVYWLRPENAMWRAINCLAMEDIVFLEPSLDLSCGDGIFSFLRAGGEFDTSFDIFGAVANLDRFFENVDIYDAPSTGYETSIARHAGYRITYGTDWKQNLLDRAATLGLYRNLRVHDNNDPLPFEDNTFETVFSNSAYWVPDLPRFFGEISRVLRPGGTAVLVLKTDAIKKYTLEPYAAWLGSQWLSMIDRGRKDHYPKLYDDAGWTELIDEAGLRVESRRPQITWVHAHIWDIGLRPLTPVLIEMANSLTRDRRSDIKGKWVDLWVRLLSPFVSLDFDIGKGDRRPRSSIWRENRTNVKPDGELRPRWNQPRRVIVEDTPARWRDLGCPPK